LEKPEHKEEDKEEVSEESDDEEDDRKLFEVNSLAPNLDFL